MSRFVSLEEAIRQMALVIKSNVVDVADAELINKANKMAKKIDKEVGTYLKQLHSIVPTQSYPRLLSKGGGVKWKPLTQKWTDRKLKAGVEPHDMFLLGITGTSKKKKGTPLHKYIETIGKGEDVAFLGQTKVWSEIKKSWNPPDARIISWVDIRSGKPRSAWFGTHEKTGKQGFIRAPSGKELTTVKLRIMPNVPMLNETGPMNLEKHLANQLSEYKPGGARQGIKLIGRNRQILAPLLRRMYKQKIAKILEKGNA